MINFPTCTPDCDSHIPALLDLFLSSDTSICSTMALPPLGNSHHVVISDPIDFPSNSKRHAPFPCMAYDILVVFRKVFVIIYGKVSLSLLLQMLLVNFVSRLKLELMYTSLIISMRSSLTNLHGFQLLELLPQFIEIPFFLFAPTE